MKKILIMITEAGGGHRASAEALREAFHDRYPGQFQIEIVDMWAQHTPMPINRLPRAYRFLVDETPWLYEFLFKTTENPEVTRSVLDAFYSWVRRPVTRALLRYAPDLIISVHPFMQHIPLRILDRLQWAVPFATVVTDWITIHPGWLHPGVDLCFVPNEEVYRLALKAGLSPEQIRLYGLPIRPAFARTLPSRNVLRQELGMAPDLPAALLVGGGEGMGPVARIAQTVAECLAQKADAAQPIGQLVVICGRNQKLLQELRGRPWPIPTVVNGFVQNMPEWMAACDCIITKAGPGTIAESLAMGLPMILSGYVIGQEEGNAEYVVDNGVGTYSEDAGEIAATVCRWFGPEHAALVEMSQKARQMGRPQSTFQIVEEIVNTLNAQTPLAPHWHARRRYTRKRWPSWLQHFGRQLPGEGASPPHDKGRPLPP